MGSEEKALGSSRAPCGVCADFGEVAYGFSKYGSDESQPLGKQDLDLVRGFTPHSDRKRELLRCPSCGTFFLYESDYEFLANGTEDEEVLTRLTPEEAQAVKKARHGKLDIEQWRREHPG